MALHVRCDCGKVLKVPEKSAGKKGKCPSCGRVVTVPAASAVRDKAPAAPHKTPGVPHALSAPAPVERAPSLPVLSAFPAAEASAPAAGETYAIEGSAQSKRFWQSTVFKVCAGGALLLFVAVVAAWWFSVRADHDAFSDAKAVPVTVKALMVLVAQPMGNSRGGSNFDLFIALLGHRGDIFQAVQRVIEDHNEARAMALLARLVAEKQGSSENDDKLVYDNALWALDCFCSTDQDVAKARQALQKYCDPRIAQKAIGELDAMYRKGKEIKKETEKD